MVNLDNTADVVRSVAIGTGGTGSGNILGITTTDHPNLATQVIGPLRAITIRFVKTFLTTFLGFSGFGTLGELLPSQASGAVHFIQQLDAKTALGIALMVALSGLLKDLLFIFTGLEQKYPLAGV